MVIYWDALLENARLSCACMFAMCKISSTQQTHLLPCAMGETHGKKKATRQTVPLPCASGSSARQRTRHTANVKKSCARHPSTRQRNTHGKKFLLQQEANRQRLEQALSYIQTLGASIGHSPPQFSPLPLPPRARAATPTPVSDLTIL